MGPGKKKNENLQQQNILQAVVVVDSFNNRFQPVSDDLPLCLFPLANQPLLSYTLEFLVASGIQQIYVYCCCFSAKVKEYLAKSKWNSTTSQCQVTPIVSSDSTSLGDILRDIDQKSLIETDFILVAGNVISNMSLEKALGEHRARREKDKNKPLMTLLLKTLPPNHTARSSDEDFVVSLDAATQQVMYYQKMNLENKKINFPVKNLLQINCAKFDLRYDLADTCVSVCSPQVPQLFTDNFDYQTREDFIRGILINEEFLGNQIHVHVVQNSFAARVSAFHMYDTISRAVLSRWVYPHVPDSDSQSLVTPVSSKGKVEEYKDESNLYQHLRHNVYLGRINSIGKDSSIENNSIVGHNTTIGSGCKITNSVIGCYCVVGDNVVIEDSYLWKGVTVKSGCFIKKALICDEAIVHENCKLKSGCILTSKIEIGPDITLNEDTAVHTETESDIFMEGGESMEKISTPEVLGIKGRGILWSESVAENSDDEIEKIIGGIWGMSVSEQDRELSESEESESSIEGESESSASDMGEDKSDDEDNSVKVFYKEVKESLMRGIEESISSSNLILEVNSSKYAYNVTVDDVIRCITRATFEIASTNSQDSSLFSGLKKISKYLCPVFLNYNKSSRIQLECIYELERYCLQNKAAYDCLIKILMDFYEKEILAEEIILRWHSKPQPVDFECRAEMTPDTLRKSITKFIDWLQEAEEESD